MKKSARLSVFVQLQVEVEKTHASMHDFPPILQCDGK